MHFITIEEIAAKWGITPRQVRSYCADNRIAGAILEHGEWRIPADAAKPERKRRRTFPTTIRGVLEAERSSRISGGLYHRLQIDITYNSNHIEGSRLTHEQTRWHHAVCDCGEFQAVLLSRATGLAARQTRAAHGHLPHRTGCVHPRTATVRACETRGEGRGRAEDIRKT